MPNLKSVLPRKIFLSAAHRTPIGKFGGSLAGYSAPKLSAHLLQQCVGKYPDLATVDAVFLGHARQAGAGPNPARQAACFAGLAESIPALTVNQACASGITAVLAAVEKICTGKIARAWAGGVESMSNTPYLLPDVRWGTKLGHRSVVDGMTRDGFHCPMADMVMGATVETFIASERKISRQSQDQFALESHAKAEAAWKQGLFGGEVLAIEPQGKLPGLSRDEHLREGLTLAQLAKLPPVFDSKQGTLTAGNSSGITDGSAWLHVSETATSSTLAELVDYEVVALDPKRMGLGPVPAISRLLERQHLKVTDIDAIEINEAFAAQVLACQQDLSIPMERLNTRGGAIALGHPIGASGARVLVTLLHILRGKKGALGIASLCVSGGQGVAVLVRAS